MDRSISRRTPLGSSGLRRLFVAAGFVLVAASSTALASEPCGTGMYPFPYTDVASVGDPFCPGIMEAYVTGISKGTSPTTFSPNDDVMRLQMTTFVQRTVDQVLARGSRRAALNQWWTSRETSAMQTVAVTSTPNYCATDGEDIWTSTGGQVVQVRANTGAILGTWTDALGSTSVLVAAGKIYVAGFGGNLYLIDPTQSPGIVTVAASTLGSDTIGITFDGVHLWTADLSGSVSIITPQATTPYPVTVVSTGFAQPYGILYDGAHVWVTDTVAGTLLQLDPNGAITKTVSVGIGPRFPAFDGANIWVPNYSSNSITVVQASTGNVVATISQDASNQLNGPTTATFDGERVLVTNQSGNSITVFKAADLSLIANVGTGASTFPIYACSDSINFWVTLSNTGSLLRF